MRYWAAAAAWAIGVAALICDHSEAPQWVIIGMHALFATVASGAMCLAFVSESRAGWAAAQADRYLFARRVSRWVYIMLYGLAAVRLCFQLTDAASLCAFPGTSCTGRAVHPLDDFQFYIACCVLPLWVIRAVALNRWAS